MKVIQRSRKDGKTWSCWGLKIGSLLMVHWHAGRAPECEPGAPWLRIRNVEVFGWRLPIKRHVI